MATVYFLGAGASAADGLPVTGQLNFGVADWLRTSGDQGKDLRAYFNDLYGLKAEDFALDGAQWRKYLSDRGKESLVNASALPNLIDTLSLIDVCINEEQSLGVSSHVESGSRAWEMNPTFLRRVREQLTAAVANSVQSAAYRWPARLTRRFVGLLEKDDAIISTNWDMLLDRCIVATSRSRGNKKMLSISPIRYHCVGERQVTWRGRDIRRIATGARPLLRLHGALNWFGCACCGTVYVNLEGSYIMNTKEHRTNHDDCHCGAGLLNVMIAPSYLKDYRNVSLRSVWREAQKRLEAAERWIFVGYSLPNDDFHIRAMLMRAWRSRASQGYATSVDVFLGEKADEAARRYKDLFRLVDLRIEFTGLIGWLEERKGASRIR